MSSLVRNSCLVLFVAFTAAGCGDAEGGDAGDSADDGESSSTTPNGGGSSGDAGGGSSGDASSGGGSSGDGSSGDGSSGDGSAGAGGASSSSGGGASSSNGAGGALPADPCPTFAAEIVEVTYGPGAGFGQDTPELVFGPPQGGGCCQGSLDVLSLGNGGSIVLGFVETRIVDGEGPDFIVFENAFWAGGDPEVPFAEVGTVEVSEDGETWLAYPCTSLEAPFGACAGWTPVLANASENDIDPLDPAAAGGEAFDLAVVGLTEARYVRIVDRADQTGFGGTFDLDAVGVVHGRCDADAP